MPEVKAPYITIANWNVGGAKILQLVSKDPTKRRKDPRVEAPRPGESREDVRAKLNTALRALLSNEPEIVTLQEVVCYAEDGKENNAEHALDISDESCFECNTNLKYRYYPSWLIDTDHQSHTGKWKKVIECGGWITDRSDPFFAQGNAILVRSDLQLYPVWGIEYEGFRSPGHDGRNSDKSQDSYDVEKLKKANEAKGHRLVEHVPLQPGLYFGDRDTEPREASVAHLVLSQLNRERKPTLKLEFPLDIFIVNVHLTTLTLERNGVPGVDREGEQIRLRQLDIILKQIVSPYNRWRFECFPIRGDHRFPEKWETHSRYKPMWVIAGDFNFTPDSNEYDAMVRGGFIDLIPRIYKRDPTARPPTKASGTDRPPTHTLDYVFAGPRFHAIDPQVADNNTQNNEVLHDPKKGFYGISDHYPLLFQVPIEVDEPVFCKPCREHAVGKQES